MAAEADQQKMIIEQLKKSLGISTSPILDPPMLSKESKLSLNAPLMSEKPNYTTAKFFEQTPNSQADYIGNSHQRVKSYRTTDPMLDSGLSEKSLGNQVHTNISTLSQNQPAHQHEQRFNQVHVNA